jgi:hypothetical protein
MNQSILGGGAGQCVSFAWIPARVTNTAVRQRIHKTIPRPPSAPVSDSFRYRREIPSAGCARDWYRLFEQFPNCGY